MRTIKMAESAAQLFARLGRKRSLDGLDNELFAGLPQSVHAQDIIELYCKEHSPKTPILLHLIANCILPKSWEGALLGGRDVSVIYVDTEYQFSLLRLVQILEQRVTSCFPKHRVPSVAAQQTFIESCLSRLLVARCNSSREFVATIESFESILCSRTDICVMMIDSISAFYWLDKCDSGELPNNKQQEYQRKLTQLLKHYTDTYYLVVIATKPAYYSKDTKWTKVKGHHEYMCYHWQNIVNYRYIVSRSLDTSPTFLFTMIKPMARNRAVKFAVVKEGLLFLDGPHKL